VADDLRQRYAEAIAAKFTYPDYRSDRDGDDDGSRRRVRRRVGPCNVITSVGREATQSVFHLHVHVVPRREGDGLALPWTPNTDRQRAEQADAALARARDLAHRLKAEAEQGLQSAVLDSQTVSWRTSAHTADLFLAALDTDPGHEPASPRHTGREEEK